MTSSASTVLDAATGDIGDDDFDEVDDLFDGSADLAALAALADELSILASLERTIRWAQAEQYRPPLRRASLAALSRGGLITHAVGRTARLTRAGCPPRRRS